MSRAIDQDTPVRLGLVIPAVTAAVAIASAAGVALYQTNANATAVKEAGAKDHAHDLELQRHSDGLRVLGEKLDDLREGQRRQDEKLDRLLRRGERERR